MNIKTSIAMQQLYEILINKTTNSLFKFVNNTRCKNQYFRNLVLDDIFYRHNDNFIVFLGYENAYKSKNMRRILIKNKFECGLK